MLLGFSALNRSVRSQVLGLEIMDARARPRVLSDGLRVVLLAGGVGKQSGDALI